ncbi:MAG TPA: hypothetical protein VMV10_32335 [Pirellulales bacterium]|nr:hypothetical protein [Pirellulales bacterium]
MNPQHPREPAEQALDTRPIFRLIGRVRHWLRGSWMATGLALSLTLYLGALLALACLDLLSPLWPTMRFFALLLVVLPSGWAFFAGVLRPLVRRMSDGHVARRIELQLPGVHNRLVSCVDIAADKRRKGYSPAFYRKLVGEALERICNFRPASVVDRRNLSRAGAACGVAVAAFIICWALLADRLPTAMARIFHPFADIPPATGVLFEVKPGSTQVLRGDDIDFDVLVTKGEPQEFRLELLPADGGAAIWHDLARAKADPSWRLTLHGLEDSFAYRVYGGGTWSKKYEIELVDRPRIVDAKAVLHYPEYLQLGAEGVVPQPTLDVTGPETSEVEVQVASAGDVVEAEIQLLDADFKPVADDDREERVWFESKAPEGAVLEGNWQWDVEKYGRPTHTEPPAAGVHSHVFHTARVGFRVEPEEWLFAWVYLPPDQKPESILLQWHDGQNWEHRAYWGEDKIGVGQPNTASRRSLGPLPPAGEWVRLEVSAKELGLDGKAIKGMGFFLSGGQAYWHRGGALPPPTRSERQLVVKQTFPLKSREPGEWSGRFPLAGEGYYRVELRNKLKHANQPMKEARYLAIPDNPPQITLERPASDIVLSRPQKLPLAIAVYDDVALKRLKVMAQRGDTDGFREAASKVYEEKLLKADLALLTLDLTTFDLKPGEHLRYRAYVEDRKGQAAETRDFLVRIADDHNAVDKQLARFEETQDRLQEKLAKLIDDQTKVVDRLEELEQKYEPLEDKLAEAEALARQEALKAAAANPQQPPPAQAPELKLDDATAKELAELRQELAQAAGQEEQNAHVARQVAGELQNAARQADEMKTLPAEIVSEMKTAQEIFDQAAAKPLGQLAEQIRQAANADKRDPHVAQMAKAAERVKQELEASAERLKALGDARKQMADQMEEALAQLRQELLEQQAGMTARGLEDLRGMIAELREELKEFEGQQAGLLDATPIVPEIMLEDLQKRQAALDRQAEPPLDEAMQLLAGDGLRQMKPAQRGEVHQPDAEDMPSRQEMAAPAKPRKQPQIRPALGGQSPQLDPKLAEKRPMPRKDPQSDPPTPTEAQREQLAERQFEQLMELNLAEQSLGADQKSLEALMEQLRAALAEAGSEGMEEAMDDMPAEGESMNDEQGPGNDEAPGQGQQPPDSPSKMAAKNKPSKGGSPQDEAASENSNPPQELSDLLDSAAVQQALAMAQRLRQASQMSEQTQQTQGRTSIGPALGNLRPTSSGGEIVTVELADLDPASRAMLLKMQPQLREELLQGMREQGPEGYRKFIQDYFQRLSTAKDPR